MKIGDKVIMNSKYYVSEKNRGRIFVVISNPRDICGTESVFLEGYTGCYAVDGLNIVKENEK